MWTNRWLAEQCTHFCTFRRSMDARLRLHANAAYSFTQGAVTLGPNRTLSRRGAAGVACTSMSASFVLQPARINTKRDVRNSGIVFQLYLVFLVQARAKNYTETWGWFWHLQVSYSRHPLLVRLVWYLHLRKHVSRQNEVNCRLKDNHLICTNLQKESLYSVNSRCHTRSDKAKRWDEGNSFPEQFVRKK